MTEHNRTWTVNYKGSADIANQRIELLTADSPNKLHLIVSDLTKHPRWAVDVSVNQLAASTLVECRARSGCPDAERSCCRRSCRWHGWLRLAIGTAGPVECRDGLVQFQDGGPRLKLAEASLFIAGDTITLAPAALTGEEDQGAQLQGEYNSGSRTLDATISGQGLRLLSRTARPAGESIPGWQMVRRVALSPGRRCPGSVERQL